MIRYSSLADASYLADGWANQVISLLDPAISQVSIPTFNVPQQIYFFEDTENPSANSITYEQVSRIILDSSSNNVLVHCHGGMRRSPAIAIGLMLWRGYTIEQALYTVFAQNLTDNEGSFIEPNMLIIRYLDQYFGESGALTRAVIQAMR